MSRTVLRGGKCYAELLRLDEPDLCTRLRVDVLNFYPAAGCQPFVPLAANGPWIITTHGAVIYDTAGYGQGWPQRFSPPPRLTLFSFHFISLKSLVTTTNANRLLLKWQSLMWSMY